MAKEKLEDSDVPRIKEILSTEKVDMIYAITKHVSLYAAKTLREHGVRVIDDFRGYSFSLGEEVVIERFRKEYGLKRINS